MAMGGLGSGMETSSLISAILYPSEQREGSFNTIFLPHTKWHGPHKCERNLQFPTYLRQVHSQQKSTKQKCDFYIKHLSGGTSKCRNARDSDKVALSRLGAT